jgi:hypothetical protein
MHATNTIMFQRNRLSRGDSETIARAIEATEWDDVSIADAARISAALELVSKARNRELREVGREQQLAFYRLLTFLGLSIKLGSPHSR